MLRKTHITFAYRSHWLRLCYRAQVTLKFHNEISSQLAFRFRIKKFKIEGDHLGYPVRMSLAIFRSTSHPDTSYHEKKRKQKNKKKKKKKKKKKIKIIYKIKMTTILDFRSERIYLFFDLQVTPMLPIKL